MYFQIPEVWGSGQQLTACKTMSKSGNSALFQKFDLNFHLPP